MSNFVKTVVQATYRNGRRIPFLLVSLFSLIIAGVGAGPAQALTYSYTGAAFDTSQCHTTTGFSIPPCVGGSITASFTLTGISAGYSGAVHKANVASWTMNASGGIGSLGTSNFLSSSSYIYFTSGQITYWQIQAGQNSAFASPVITTIDGSYEEAYAGYPPTYPPPLYGYSQPYPIEGIWTNPKALGPSLPPPQVAD